MTGVAWSPEAAVDAACAVRVTPCTALPTIAETCRASLASAPLPPLDRPGAGLCVLDITKWFGETSGGVRTYLTEKARYVQARQSLRQILVVPGPFDGYALGDGVRTYRMRGPLIPTQSAYRFLFATRSTRRVVEHERPDLVEVGSPFFVPWVAALATRRLGTPMVAFHHSSLAAMRHTLGLGVATGRGWLRLTGAYLRRMNRLFQTTIAASEYAAVELRRAGIERVTHVPLGVDLDLFRPVSRSAREWTRRRLGLPIDRPLLVFMGRVSAEKRLDLLLTAWSAIASRTGAHLLVAGSGRELARLRAGATSDAIHWLPHQGDREQVARILGATDLYVSPSDTETFGLAALEAMAAGVPVLSAAAGGGGELVQRSGAGFVFAPGDGGDLADVACRALAEDLAHVGARARAYAEREHAWETTFDRLFACYRTVIQP